MGSPIETALFRALCAAAERHEVLLGEVVGEELREYGALRPDARGVYAIVDRDHAVASYRIDILIRGHDWSLAIECDGHDFHDRTKQQAAYDRSRDRELILRGITTIRFTGSEIAHSAERCAEEAIRVIEYLHARHLYVHDLLDRCGEIHRREL